MGLADLQPFFLSFLALLGSQFLRVSGWILPVKPVLVSLSPEDSLDGLRAFPETRGAIKTQVDGRVDEWIWMDGWLDAVIEVLRSSKT